MARKTVVWLRMEIEHADDLDPTDVFDVADTLADSGVIQNGIANIVEDRDNIDEDEFTIVSTVVGSDPARMAAEIVE